MTGTLRKYVVLGLASVAVAVLASALVAPRRNADATGMVPATVSTSVSAFSGRTVDLLESTRTAGSVEQFGMKTYVDARSGDEYVVDDRGVLKSYVHVPALRRSDGKQAKLTDDNITAIAKSFAAARFGDIDLGSSRIAIERKVAGVAADGTQADQVVATITEYREGVPSCNFVRMLLDPETGEVLLVNHDAGALPTDLEPTVTSESAAAQVAAALKMPVYSSRTAELRMWRAPGSHDACLVWRVTLRTGDSSFGARGFGIVDAHSGKLLAFGL